MKKIFSAIISSPLKGRLGGVLFALLATTTLYAQSFQVGDLHYNITSSSEPYTVKVSDAVSSITTATIPETVTYNGTTYSVTSIGNSAFYYCSSLTSVTIPNSVTSIGYDAFYFCSSLTSVTIPNSVTSIGDKAFYYTGIYNNESNWENGVLYIDNCLIAAKIYINDVAYTIKDNTRLIADYAFAYCDALTSVTIGNSVTSIGDYAFAYCDALTSVTIPNSVTSIGNSAFYDCSSITSITIPNSVTSIGDQAFYDCSSITSITIPNSVTSIGDQAFYDCSSITSITIPNSITSIGNSTFTFCTFVKDNFINNSTLDAVANNYWGAEIVDVDADGLLIRNDTVIDCRPFVTSITIPNSVTSIGDYAFYNCDALTSVTIPNSVTSIGNGAFSNCDALTSVTIPNSVTSIGNGAFYNCDALTSVTIPNSVTSIGNSAFSNCDALTSVTIPNSVTSIGDYAFSNCDALTSVTIPNSVTSIGNYAFDDCDALTSVTIPNSVTSIGNYAFSYCDALTSVTIPNSVISIGNSAFDDCDALTSVTIPNSVISIGDQAFYNCSSLKSIHCKALTPPELSTSSFTTDAYDNATLHVPFESYADYIEHSIWGTFKNIQYIDTFYNNDICYQYILGKELLSKTLTAEDDFNAFTNISITGTQTWHYSDQYGAKMSGYSDADSRTYSNEDWLISPAMDLSNYSSATLTFSHAFGPRSSIPTTDAQKAQYTCWVSNDFNGDVTTASWTELPISYGTSAWNYISTVVDIPTENLKENCCVAWKYVCENSSATWEIKSINVSGNYLRPNVKVIALSNKYSNDIIIPSIATNNYVDYKVTTIAASAFSNCSSLTSISIPNSVTTIGSEAFSGCTLLESITIPNSITSLSNNVFTNCTSLNEVTLPASITSIGENAFAGCTKLYDIYCYAMEPPTAYDSSFANYNAFLHVPCDNQRVYLLDVVFGNFKYIECIEAETIPTDTIVVTPSFNDAEFTWPSYGSADSYTLAISKDGEIFCTLTFNANGQLTGIAFAPSRNGQHNAPAAAQMANGFAFTVTGLDEGANYTYELLIQDRSGNTLQSYSGEFRTQSTNDRTVTVEYDAAQGQVTGAGTYLVGDTVTLTAIPNDGYRFVRWSNEVEDNPYTFVILDNVTLSAEFEAVIHSDVENTTPSQQSDTHKFLRNGQLLIIRDGKTYNTMGAEIR